ncbi:MAG TPA: methylated-DNA--[protein]-cysteine S-methyltransferase [Candidatus Limnocylindria bacterium]|nr:methylated-DNA--[protein]-cysteine S-methyltransferase [Candidatus Limnocylindria bacterium]
MILETATAKSPLGPIQVVARDGKLCGLEFSNHSGRLTRDLERRFGTVTRRPAADPAGAVRALADYFDGDVQALDTLEVDTGGTAFQRGVWAALRCIPAGKPISYGELAARIGAPGAARAVGSANGANPVSLVVPCHRVIASGGNLGGYGGGLDRKRWLLDHEAAAVGRIAAAL